MLVRPSQVSVSPSKNSTLSTPQLSQAGRQSNSPAAAEPRYFYNPNYAEMRDESPENRRPTSQSKVQVVPSTQPEEVHANSGSHTYLQPAKAEDSQHSIVNKKDTQAVSDPQIPGSDRSGSRFGQPPTPPPVEAPPNSKLSFGNPSLAREPTPPQSERKPAVSNPVPQQSATFKHTESQSQVSRQAEKSPIITQPTEATPTKYFRKGTSPLPAQISTSDVRPVRAVSAPAPLDFYRHIKVEDVQSDTVLSPTTERNLAIIEQFVANNGLQDAVEHVIYNNEDEEFVVKAAEPLDAPDRRRPSAQHFLSSLQKSTQKFKIVPLYELDPARASALLNQGAVISA